MSERDAKQLLQAKAVRELSASKIIIAKNSRAALLITTFRTSTFAALTRSGLGVLDVFVKSRDNSSSLLILWSAVAARLLYVELVRLFGAGNPLWLLT